MRGRPANGTQSLPLPKGEPVSPYVTCSSTRPSSILLPTHQSIQNSTHPSIHLPIHLPSIHPPIQPPIHPLVSHPPTHHSSPYSPPSTPASSHPPNTNTDHTVRELQSRGQYASRASADVYTRPFLWEHSREGAVCLGEGRGHLSQLSKEKQELLRQVSGRDVEAEAWRYKRA